MILFYDTETTGFYRSHLPPDHPDQPRVVQLAALLCETDGTPVGSISLVVNPGCEIPEAASNVHGITTERAAQIGVPPKVAVTAFYHLYRHATLQVDHNLDFDLGIMQCEIARQHNRIVTLDCEGYCTMKAATPICRLPNPKGSDFKWPKLSEAVRHFFDEELEGAHDALIDVMACKRVYFHLTKGN